MVGRGTKQFCDSSAHLGSPACRDNACMGLTQVTFAEVQVSCKRCRLLQERGLMLSLVDHLLTML